MMPYQNKESVLEQELLLPQIPSPKMTDPGEGLRCARDLGGGIAGKPQPELRGTQETVASTLQETQ